VTLQTVSHPSASVKLQRSKEFACPEAAGTGPIPVSWAGPVYPSDPGIIGHNWDYPLRDCIQKIRCWHLSDNVVHRRFEECQCFFTGKEGCSTVSLRKMNIIIYKGIRNRIEERLHPNLPNLNPRTEGHQALLGTDSRPWTQSWMSCLMSEGRSPCAMALLSKMHRQCSFHKCNTVYISFCIHSCSSRVSEASTWSMLRHQVLRQMKLLTGGSWSRTANQLDSVAQTDLEYAHWVIMCIPDSGWVLHNWQIGFS
jgi:hypothetical protein